MSDGYKKHTAYIDAFCAAFNAWPTPVARNEFEQQLIDRGLWDGRKQREVALAAQVETA